LLSRLPNGAGFSCRPPVNCLSFNRMPPARQPPAGRQPAWSSAGRPSGGRSAASPCWAARTWHRAKARGLRGGWRGRSTARAGRRLWSADAERSRRGLGRDAAPGYLSSRRPEEGRPSGCSARPCDVQRGPLVAGHTHHNPVVRLLSRLPNGPGAQLRGTGRRRSLRHPRMRNSTRGRLKRAVPRQLQRLVRPQHALTTLARSGIRDAGSRRPQPDPERRTRRRLSSQERPRAAQTRR